MERWTVIGFRKIDFEDSSQGKRITGYSLFLTRPGDDNFVGEECQKLFVSDQKVDYVPQLGDDIQIVYNRFGKVGNIILC